VRNKNVEASIYARLGNKARAEGRPFQDLLERFAMERFLYRLSLSPHRASFILKGALLLRARDTPAARPTRDIDFLGSTENSLKNISGIVSEICAHSVVPGDCLVFSSFRPEKIREDADYEGVRVRFRASLANARIPMQIDVGFGDVMVPGAQPIAYPALLDFPEPKLLGYPLESVVAEKIEALVQLGTINSRMKDFYDLWHLTRRFNFEGGLLAQALRATFARRGTPLDTNPVGLSADFAKQNDRQWKAFLRRIDVAGLEFSAVLAELSAFAKPLLEEQSQGLGFSKKWEAPGPWR
jgi:predicted nucleotidyltransferase component of viral defense system